MANERGPQPFSPTAAAKRVLRTARTAALGTLTSDGAPFASLVTVATAHNGEPILLISRLAVHTQNLAGDARASLLLVEPGGEAGDPLAGARLTVTGRVGDATADDVLRRRFLARHPEAQGYAAFADFGFRRFDVHQAHLVAGFGRIIGLSREDVLTDVSGAEDIVAADESAVEHMNNDHRETLSLYATRLLNLPPGDWKATGVDPEGIDLATSARDGRLSFGERVTSAGRLRVVLADLAKAARASS